MDLSKEKQKELSKRLLLARMRLLCNNGFYGLLLMHMGYALSEEFKTAATDANKIYFNPDFLSKLSDSELDFVLMHEVLHVALKHCFRREDRDQEGFNIACDIVVNSTILGSKGGDLSSISLRGYGPLIHLTPDGKEGRDFTAEQVYAMLPAELKEKKIGTKRGKKGEPKPGDEDRDGGGEDGQGKGKPNDEEKDGFSGKNFDDHSKWKMAQEDKRLKDLWDKRLVDAAEAISIRDPSNDRGSLPAFARRILNELKNPQTDWRTLLNDFVQEEICDYSFSPPDRRFSDSPFLLPDFNEKDFEISDILFMIDTSGSMSDAMITQAYSEVKGAIDQFGGKLEGWLGFFDAVVVPPVPFSNVDELKVIRPVGGGGTSFRVIFDYVRKMEKKPVSIIILTDGYAPFPKEEKAEGIPVLWLVNNQEVTPPWGKVARIKIEE